MTYLLTCRNSGCRGLLYHNSQSDLREHRNILGESFRLVLSRARDTDPDARHHQQAQLIKRDERYDPNESCRVDDDIDWQHFAFPRKNITIGDTSKEIRCVTFLRQDAIIYYLFDPIKVECNVW